MRFTQIASLAAVLSFGVAAAAMAQTTPYSYGTPAYGGYYSGMTGPDYYDYYNRHTPKYGYGTTPAPRYGSSYGPVYPYGAGENSGFYYGYSNYTSTPAR